MTDVEAVIIVPLVRSSDVTKGWSIKNQTFWHTWRVKEQMEWLTFLIFWEARWRNKTLLQPVEDI